MKSRMRSRLLAAGIVGVMLVGWSTPAARAEDAPLGGAARSGGLQVDGTGVMKVTYDQGSAPTLAGINGLPAEGEETVGATQVALANTSNTAYLVTPSKIEGLRVPGDLVGDDYIGLYIGHKDHPTISRQIIAGDPGVKDKFSPIRIDAGQTAYVWVYLWGKHGKKSFERLAASKSSFNVLFNYEPLLGGPVNTAGHRSAFHLNVRCVTDCPNLVKDAKALSNTKVEVVVDREVFNDENFFTYQIANDRVAVTVGHSYEGMTRAIDRNQMRLREGGSGELILSLLGVFPVGDKKLVVLSSDGDHSGPGANEQVIYSEWMPR